jgi:hypothetical protein
VIVLVPLPLLTFSGIKMGMMMMAMGVKIFRHMLRNLRKNYASIPAFSNITRSSWILKTVASHFNGLLCGALILCRIGTRKDLGW